MWTIYNTLPEWAAEVIATMNMISAGTPTKRPNIAAPNDAKSPCGPNMIKI